jgi:hypothetical protein
MDPAQNMRNFDLRILFYGNPYFSRDIRVLILLSRIRVISENLLRRTG